MCNNRERYNKEREERWWIANKYEQPAIEALVKKINNKFNNKIVSKRYDDIWFKEFNPETNKWVRGSSDFYLDIIGGNYNHLYMYTEVKIKNTQFDGTIYGKTLKNGQEMSKYGCKSFYLDIYPVHKHMNEFCDRVGIGKNTFTILFTDSKFNSMRVISLEEINKLIKTGWNGCTISEIENGYGQRSYLIPIDATHKVDDLSGQQIRDYCSEMFIKPE